MTNDERRMVYQRVAALMRRWMRENLCDLVVWVVAVVLALLVMELLSGCAGTVTPRVVRDNVASWDGTNQNSGFIGWAPDGSGIITSHARDRYNGLVAIYGSHFLPPVTADAGLTGTSSNAFLIDPQHMEYFATMQRLRKEGK